MGFGALDGPIKKGVGHEVAPLCTPFGSMLGLVFGSMVGPRALQECTLQEGVHSWSHVAPLGQMVVFGSLVDTVMHKFGADSGMDVGVHFRV